MLRLRPDGTIEFDDIQELIAYTKAYTKAARSNARVVPKPKTSKPVTQPRRQRPRPSHEREGSLVANVIALLDEQPTKAWSIVEIWDALDPKPKTYASLCSQLRLWLEQGRIASVGRGQYRAIRKIQKKAKIQKREKMSRTVAVSRAAASASSETISVAAERHRRNREMLDAVVATLDDEPSRVWSSSALCTELSQFNRQSLATSLSRWASRGLIHRPQATHYQSKLAVTESSEQESEQESEEEETTIEEVAAPRELEPEREETNDESPPMSVLRVVEVQEVDALDELVDVDGIMAELNGVTARPELGRTRETEDEDRVLLALSSSPGGYTRRELCSGLRMSVTKINDALARLDRAKKIRQSNGRFLLLERSLA